MQPSQDLKIYTVSAFRQHCVAHNVQTVPTNRTIESHSSFDTIYYQMLNPDIVFVIAKYSKQYFMLVGMEYYANMHKLISPDNIKLVCNIITVPNEQQLMQLFAFYNVMYNVNKEEEISIFTRLFGAFHFTPVKSEPIVSVLNSNNVLALFMELYPLAIIDAPNIKRPYISKPNLIEVLSSLNYVECKLTLEQIKSHIKDFNDSIDLKPYRLSEADKRLITQISCKLGMLGKLNAFDVSDITDIPILPTVTVNTTDLVDRTNVVKRKRKANISAQMKQMVWEKQFKNMGKGICPTCNTNEITPFKFECAHIIPESRGGPTNLDNLIPSCQSCNRSTGTKTQPEYKRELDQFKTTGL